MQQMLEMELLQGQQRAAHAKPAAAAPALPQHGSGVRKGTTSKRAAFVGHLAAAPMQPQAGSQPHWALYPLGQIAGAGLGGGTDAPGLGSGKGC